MFHVSRETFFNLYNKLKAKTSFRVSRETLTTKYCKWFRETSKKQFCETFL